MPRVRIDKWLWAARFFKTRALAAKACELGRVALNGRVAKAAHDVDAGDMLQVRTEAGEFQVQVLGVSEMRGPAPVAQTLYRETEASQQARAKALEERRTMREFASPRQGRPSKRDRRDLNRLRGR